LRSLVETIFVGWPVLASVRAARRTSPGVASDGTNRRIHFDILLLRHLNTRYNRIYLIFIQHTLRSVGTFRVTRSSTRSGELLEQYESGGSRYRRRHLDPGNVTYPQNPDPRRDRSGGRRPSSGPPDRGGSELRFGYQTTRYSSRSSVSSSSVVP